MRTFNPRAIEPQSIGLSVTTTSPFDEPVLFCPSIGMVMFADPIDGSKRFELHIHDQGREKIQRAPLRLEVRNTRMIGIAYAEGSPEAGP